MNVFSTYSVYVSPLLLCYFRILFVFSLCFIIIPILIIICLTFSFFNSQLMHVYLLGWFLQYRQHPPLYWRGVSSRVRFADRGNAVRSQSPCSRWKTYEDPDVVPQPLRFIPKRTSGVQPPLNFRNPSAGEIFSHCFHADVLKMLCTNTNENAAKNLQSGERCE